MPRGYRKLARADSERSTRERVLEAVLANATLTPFGVREVAAAAGVTVQTVYSHFGSKSGLIAAVIAEASRRGALFDAIDQVWVQRDGSSALDLMIRVTFQFWNKLWPFIQLSLVARRTDHEYAEQIRKLDESRLADLVRICDRLSAEGRLKNGLSAKSAAALAFALTTPYIYEELVAVGRMPARNAEDLLVATVSSAIVAGDSDSDRQ